MRIVMNLVYSVAHGAWRLERDGHMIAAFDTKAEALCAAQMRGERLAEMGSEARVVVHSKDGAIEGESTYGAPLRRTAT